MVVTGLVLATSSQPAGAQDNALVDDVVESSKYNGGVTLAVRTETKGVRIFRQASSGTGPFVSMLDLGGCVEDVAILGGTVVGIGCGSHNVFVSEFVSIGIFGSTHTDATPWENLGGCAEEVQLARGENGRSVLAVIGCGSRSVFTRTEIDRGGPWTSWKNLGGCVEDMELQPQADETLAVVAIGCGSRSMFVRTQTVVNADTWTAWNGLGGCVESMDVEATVDDALAIVAVGCGSHSVFVKTQDAADLDEWGAWVGLGGCVRSLDATAAIADKLFIMAIGCGGNTPFFGREWPEFVGWFALPEGPPACLRNVHLARRSSDLIVAIGSGCPGADLLISTEEFTDDIGNPFPRLMEWDSYMVALATS